MISIKTAFYLLASARVQQAVKATCSNGDDTRNASLIPAYEDMKRFRAQARSGQLKFLQLAVDGALTDTQRISNFLAVAIEVVQQLLDVLSFEIFQ